MSAIRRAVRSLIATPSATALTILTLSLGIGCSTAMIAIAEALLLRPLPLHEPGPLAILQAPGLRIAGLVGACMLAMGCLNAVNLLLARALAGQHDLGVRLALGASTKRLLWPLLLESLLIGGLSGALGIAAASQALDTSHEALQTMLGTASTFTLDGRVTALAVLLVATCSITCGIVPAWLATRRASLAGLHDRRRLVSSRGVLRARGVLVLAEVALATALLVTTGLLARSYWRLVQIDPGVDASQVVTLRVAPTGDVYQDDAVRMAHFDRVEAAVTVLGTGTLVALVLALIGLYGVLTHDVRQRAREIGLRMAVGASPRQILHLVAADGALLLAIGCGVGIALASLVGTVIEGQLFEVSALDVLTYAIAVVLFSVVGMAATAVPAWRAAHLDPAAVLRQQ